MATHFCDVYHILAICYTSCMPFKITAGIDESELSSWLAEALQKYGLYEGNGVDFTHADKAPIVMCTVLSGDEILLAKRGYGLADAEGYWSTINGFIDVDRPVKQIAQNELKEELGLKVDTTAIKVASSYILENPKEKRQYIVFPCLVNLDSKPEIQLDREHTAFAWITRKQLSNYKTLDDLPYAIDRALALH